MAALIRRLRTVVRLQLARARLSAFSARFVIKTSPMPFCRMNCGTQIRCLFRDWCTANPLSLPETLFNHREFDVGDIRTPARVKEDEVQRNACGARRNFPRYIELHPLIARVDGVSLHAVL